jgi:hypothetical protein
MAATCPAMPDDAGWMREALQLARDAAAAGTATDGAPCRSGRRQASK